MAVGVQKPVVTITAYADVTTDITAHVLFPMRAEWGINGNGAEDRMASTGSIDFEMNNYTTPGKYVPGHSACLSGWKKGTPVDVSFVYDGQTKTKRWYLFEHEVVGELEERVRIVCVDWIDKLSTHPIINPNLLQNSTLDEGLDEVVAAFPVPPQSTDFDTGTNVFLTLLDVINRFTKAMTVFSQMIASELGYLYLRDYESLRFEKMLSRHGARSISSIPLHTDLSGILQDENSATITDENGDTIYVSDGEDNTYAASGSDIIEYDNESGKNIINRFSVSFHPRRTDEEIIVLYEPERPIFISSGERKIIREYFTDPSSKRTINAIPPVQDDYTKALLHFEGLVAHQAQFDDEVGRTWICQDVEIVDDLFGTAPKFGTGAAYCDGSASYFYTAHSDDLEFGTGDWTIDWWEYRFNTTSGWASVSRDGAVAFPAFLLAHSNGTNNLVSLSSNGSSFDIANGKSLGSVSINQWVHLAVVRSGNNFYAFKNGVLQSQWTSSASLFATSAALTVARNVSAYNNCCYDELRISKGIARWTDNFTPPTEQYQLEGTFLFGYQNEDGTGTEFTNDLVMSVDYGTEGATYDIENDSATSGYLFLRTLGYGIHLDSPSEINDEKSASVSEIGTYEVNHDLTYQQDGYVGKLEAEKVIEEEFESRVVLDKISMNANRSRKAMMQFMGTDIGDLIQVEIDTIEKNTRYWVQQKGFEVQSGMIIDWWVMLKEHYSLHSGLDDLAIEFRGGANTDCITFPYMPYVAGDEITEFTMSAWVYLDTEPTSNSYFVCGPYIDGAGSGLFISTTDRKAMFYNTRFNTSPGQWSTPADPFSLSTWAHVIIKYRIELGQTPVIKVNNSLQTLVQDVTPAGTLTSAKGANFFIGNVKTPALNYSRCYDGKIRDVRFYPFLTTDAQDTIIYNSGTYNPLLGNDGQVFQAFAVKSNRYAAYTDLSLTAITRIVETNWGVVGTPNGAPIARTP